jgi:hypothetical protein
VLAGQRVVGWNMQFDIAWLIATGHDVSQIKWFDGLLLWKWLMNSQRTDHGAWRWSNVPITVRGDGRLSMR